MHLNSAALDPVNEASRERELPIGQNGIGDLLRTYSHPEHRIPVTEGELWTARQRQMHPIHYTVSYRASFKPELPDYFIRKFLQEEGRAGALVLDPFGGRGTTALQSNLLGYTAHHNDLNPVSIFLSSSRQMIPSADAILERLESLSLKEKNFRLTDEEKEKLLPFFHPETLREIMNLRDLVVSDEGKEDPVMRYIGVTALSRLHGHSDGFFSVYTFPQISILPGAQKKNNLRRGQTPEYKDVKERILRKMRKDLSVEIPDHFHPASRRNRYTTHDSRDLASVKSGSVDLVVTSPPFLDKVDYITDNWMRFWFLKLEEQMHRLNLGLFSDVNQWKQFMADTIREMGRILRTNGRAVIEVGEVKSAGRLLMLEEVMMELLPMKVRGGTLVAEQLYINRQSFTKLAHCWSVENNQKGTNSNRCLVIRKVK